MNYSDKSSFSFMGIEMYLILEPNKPFYSPTRICGNIQCHRVIFLSAHEKLEIRGLHRTVI